MYLSRVLYQQNLLLDKNVMVSLEKKMNYNFVLKTVIFYSTVDEEETFEER